MATPATPSPAPAPSPPRFELPVGAAWEITWKRPGLWLLGLFAGGASGSCGGSIPNFNTNLPAGAGTNDFPAAFPRAQIDQAITALQQALPVLIVVGALVVVIGLALWLLSVACRCGVIAGGGLLAAVEPASIGAAWRAGLRSFGALFVLDLLVLVIWLLVLGVIGAFVVSSVAGRTLAPLDWLRVFLIAATAIGLLALIGSVVGIGIAYAQRAIVLDRRAPMAALGSGFGLLRERLGTSLLVWIVGIALQIGLGIGIVLALVVLLIPGAVIVGVAFLLQQGGVGIGLGILIAFVFFLVSGACVNTFMWHYWTLAYLRLTR